MSEHDFSPEDPLPALRAEVDQAVAMSPELARMAGGLFRAFAEEGFSERQALYLTACHLHSSPGNAPA